MSSRTIQLSRIKRFGIRRSGKRRHVGGERVRKAEEQAEGLLHGLERGNEKNKGRNTKEKTTRKGSSHNKVAMASSPVIFETIAVADRVSKYVVWWRRKS